jgi:hypothetical protein
MPFGLSQPPGPLWVIRVDLTLWQLLPVYPNQRTSSAPVGMSQRCQQRTSITEMAVVFCDATRRTFPVDL